MTFELIHTSPTEIKEINSRGRFGTWLFFSDKEYSMGGFETLAYKLEVDDDDIVDARQFFYRDDCEKLKELVEEVMEMTGEDEDSAQDILSDRGFMCCEELSWDSPDIAAKAAELSWDLQYMTAKAAKALGYSVVEMRDEQGACWMVDASVHFKNMELV
jgi:hypothetical protein